MIRRFRLAAYLIASLALCSPAVAQHGVEAKPKPSDYPVHGDAGGVGIGAEYLVRSVGGERDMFVVDDYLVVHVAVYPPKGRPVDVSTGHFRLRINGKNKELRLAQTPGMVAASLKYSDWERRRNLEVGGGMGDQTVILGRRRETPRFPGDRRDAENRLPGPVTKTDQAGGSDSPEERVVETALPEGPAAGPFAGHLYFAYKGKPKRIKSLELIYDTGDRQSTLRFF
jgi:hypothetical protein